MSVAFEDKLDKLQNTLELQYADFENNRVPQLTNMVREVDAKIVNLEVVV